jgi:hypothetical protein
MSIQFQRSFLLEEGAPHWLKEVLIELGADEQAANMLVAAVEVGHLTPERAIAVVKNTTGVNEEGGSGTPGAGSFLPSLHASEKDVKGPELEEMSGIPFNTADDYKINGQIVNYKWVRDNKYIFQTQGSPTKLIAVSDVNQVKDSNGKDIVTEIGDGGDTPTFKVGQEVTYLGHPAIITKVEKDMMDRWNYNVSYDKGTGKTKASNILNKGGEIKALKEDAPILAGGKIKDNYAVSHFGYKEVPKGHAKLKGIIVKDLWESEQEAASEILSLLAHPAFKRSLERLYDEAPSERSNRIKQLYDALYGELKKSETLQENYHRFKKETVTRTKAQQMHEAAKAIEKKLHEVNKILEYTSKLKSELFEEEGDSEVSHHTKKVMEKVTKSIAEAYSKLKNIK